MNGTLPDWLPKRPGMLLPVVGAHVGALLLIVSSHGAPASPVAGRRLTIFDVTAPRAPAAQAQAAAPAPVEPIVAPPPVVTPPVQSPILVSQPQSSPENAPGSGVDCDLTDVVQTAVRQSAPARSALLMLPRNARSVANAVMLWDGRWSEGATTSTRYALGKIRDVVTKAVADASPDCRAAVQAGPRLATVPGAPDFVIAFGSGRWRWGDLDAPILTVAVNDVANQRPAPAHLTVLQRPN